MPKWEEAMTQMETSNLHTVMQMLVEDVGTAFSGALVLLGDRLALYRGMRGMRGTSETCSHSTDNTRIENCC